MIGMPVLVMLNSWLVAIVSPRWKNQPPTKKAIINVLAFVIDIILLVSPVLISVPFLTLDGFATHKEVFLLVFMGVLFTIQSLFFFFRWIRPRIVA